jgi:hypothetical protein
MSDIVTMSQHSRERIYPKSKSELFQEYNNLISYGTFRKWIKELSDAGKIRPGKKILNTKEVQIVYHELGIPGQTAQLEIEFS